MILVVLENQRGKIHPFSVESVVAGQKIAKSLNQPLSILCVGDNIDPIHESAKQFDCSELILASHPLLKTYSADGFSKIIVDLIKSYSPKYCIFGHSYMVRDYVPRVSANLSIPFISDITSINLSSQNIQFSKQVFNAKLSSRIENESTNGCLLSFQSAAFSADELIKGAPEKVTNFEVQLSDSDIRSTTEEEFQESSSGVDLSTAELIVSVGRGIDNQDNIPIAEELAKVLGAELASSRPVVDMGWLPPFRQIGSSGQTVSPKLYFALGISGAIQHVVGMKGSKNIIAINKDEEAPIFEIADYAVIGDLIEIAPLLTEELRKR
jgi:electron transfer flavoprotein alpha subunit